MASHGENQSGEVLLLRYTPAFGLALKFRSLFLPIFNSLGESPRQTMIPETPKSYDRQKALGQKQPEEAQKKGLEAWQRYLELFKGCPRAGEEGGAKKAESGAAIIIYLTTHFSIFFISNSNPRPGLSGSSICPFLGLGIGSLNISKRG